MKIAIQGHPTRGKEVIQILESLGGKKLYYLNASDKCLLFFIDDKEYISCIHHESPLVKECFKIYTLEEFEKEFPFKVGDEVIIICFPDFPKIITQIVWDCDEILYTFEGLNNTWFGVKTLKKFEMKEERNITLTLNKAKEWYKKGGELREISLQAFTEKELNPLPRSWEEFCEKYPIKNGECWVGSQDIIHSATFPQDRKYKTWIPSRRSAEAHLAMIQLEQLRDCYRQGWIPDYDDGTPKYYIYIDCNGVSVGTTYYASRFLTFQDQIIATEFARNFLFLIKKAGDLI